ncbi:iron chaperone [Oenococcus sp.]|uniref:iron chaperone n=1 Tax=Oenococcus sp. TaxID=1979414 RepID=UPI0039E7CF83
MAEKTGFSDFEKEAMRDRIEELRREQSNNKDPKKGEADVLEKISEMTGQEADIALKLHRLVHKIAPQLRAKTWYSMPAYCNPDGKVLLFFQCATKFKSRYNTLGFSDQAHLDHGTLWPNSFALTAWTAATEAQVSELIQRALTPVK